MPSVFTCARFLGVKATAASEQRATHKPACTKNYGQHVQIRRKKATGRGFRTHGLWFGTSDVYAARDQGPREIKHVYDKVRPATGTGTCQHRGTSAATS